MKNQCIKLSIDHYPFKTSLSLLPIISYWQQKIEDENPMISGIARELELRLEGAPELSALIEDPNLIEKHKHTISLLMSAVFPLATYDKEVSGALTPFEMYSFYHTPLFKAAMLDGNHYMQYPESADAKAMLYNRIFYTYALILKKYYGRDVYVDKGVVFMLKDEQTSLDRYYKIVINSNFIEVKRREEARPVSNEDLEMLIAHFLDLDLWMQYMPPEHFEVEGFIVLTLIDITDQEVVSALKYSLLEGSSIISQEKFFLVQRQLQVLLKKPGLELGISAFQKERNKFVNFGRKISHSFTARGAESITCSQSLYAFYEELIAASGPLFFENIASSTLSQEMKEVFISQGIQGIVFTPLYFEGEVIGILELASPHKADLTAISLTKLESVLPLFSLAVKLSFEQEENRIESIIKEKFTAIHPSVEWRFREAALNLFEKQEKKENADIEPIVFNEVYPLYGAADIRNSSLERNKAISGDLLTQLGLAKAVLDTLFSTQSLPIYAKLIRRISKSIHKIKNGLLTDAEVAVHEFLKKEIEPVLRHIELVHPPLHPLLQAYWNALDGELGVVYDKRKDFEQSLTTINETLSLYLDQEEDKAQSMFPHYFEKYKTDGIEYNIYIGASLVEALHYDFIYLKNLRLWQLITMCEIAKKMKELGPLLKVPLETTQLILVHGMPLSIRFRMDERHFDVDGAYNIRYEILKKRIDKVLIKGTHERLTQPGKIVVIYTQFKEASEYNEYIEHLQEEGLLNSGVERLDLEDVQGVQGLKALRVEVNLQEVEGAKKKAKQTISSKMPRLTSSLS